MIQLVLFDAVARPLGIELKLMLALLFRFGDRDEVRTRAAAGNLFIGDSLVAKAEMAGRLVERRVDDWVLDDHLAHTVPVSLAAGIRS